MAHITFSEGSGINNSIFGKSQEPIKMVIEKKAEAFEANSQLDALFSFDKSNNWAEKVTSMTSMGGPEPVGENGVYPVDGYREGPAKVLENVTWKDSFSLSREIIDDGKIGDLRKKPASFVTAYYRTREMYGAALIGNAIAMNDKFKFKKWGFDTLGADGKCLFHEQHPSVTNKKLVQSNAFGDYFTAENLAKAESIMQNTRDEDGYLLDLRPDTILIPNIASLKKDVFAAIGADKNPVDSTNAFNFTFGRWNVIVWNYLNDYLKAGIEPWILLDSNYNKEYGGAMWYDRVDLEVRSELADNDANVWKMYARFIAGFNDWRPWMLLGGDGVAPMP